MFALCIETSHARGMGHFFRALNLATALGKAGHSCKIYLNAHEPSLRLLKGPGIGHAIVDLDDLESDWESRLIKREGIHKWINDRLNTDVRHATNVKRCGVPLATFDDRGSGAALADLNIVALAFDAAEPLPGRCVLRGVEYLILNPSIVQYRRIRQRSRRLLVSLGGSDTYGLTVKVVRCLRAAGRTATVILGPGFRHDVELSETIGLGFEVKRAVPSLIAEFEKYDLAITGGGITPFEANASGLPCIIVASEPHEIAVGAFLHGLGSSVFAGHYREIDERVFDTHLSIEAMSRTGIQSIGTNGLENVCREILAL